MKIIVAIYDRATEDHKPLMTVNTRAEAIRSLRDALKDDQSPLAQHPTDYELYQIGTYNEVTGEIQADRQLIIRAEDAK